MKKQVVFSSVMLTLLCGTLNNAAPSAKEQKSTIDSRLALAYTEGFGEQSDTANPLNHDTIAKIKNALDEVKKFTSNALWVKQSILTDSLITIIESNNSLIDSIRISRSSDDSLTQNQMKQNFVDITTKMDEVINRLEKKWYVSEIKGLARSLLISTAKHIKDAAQHAMRAQQKKIESKKTP